MDFALNLFVLLLSAYFAKQEYDNNHIRTAMLWSMLFGWNLHTFLGIL